MAIQQMDFTGMEQYRKPEPQPSILTIVQQAIENKLDGQQLNALMDFAERWHANEAKQAFARAFAEFKRNVPRIVKNAEIRVNNQVRGTYATLDEVCEKLIPGLAQVGIAHRWVTKTQDNGKLTVTCLLKHELGYEEEGSSLTSNPDTSGSKNAIQADCSTVSYLERYTLLASCGVPVYGTDRDGNSQKKEDPDFVPMAEGDVVTHLDWIDEAQTVEDLQKYYLNAAKIANDAKDKKALAAFDDAKKKAWRRIKGGAR